MSPALSPRALVALGLLTALSGCERIRATVVDHYPDDYSERAVGAAQAASAPAVVPVIDGADASRAQIPVAWAPVEHGLGHVTDVQFPPVAGQPAALGQQPMVVLEKEGKVHVRRHGAAYVLLEREVLTKSEQGMLGWAFHPDFWSNGRAYLNHSVEDSATGDRRSRVSELTLDPRATPWTVVSERTVMDVRQPYANHDAGQLAFGPDGMLYIGWGDGGWRGDPDGNGQNRTTFLGAMLRVDVSDPSVPYVVPPDNPFVGDGQTAPEIWALGLRNPWRYSFAPDGRLVVADVGQDAWEEVHIVSRGDNLGWNHREGRHCYPPDESACYDRGYRDPVYEYGRSEGQSITGGYVYAGTAVPALTGKYVFGDFLTGRVWALDLPASAPMTGDDAPLAPVSALGRVDLLISTFGLDGAGDLYLGDYKEGVVYRLTAP